MWVGELVVIPIFDEDEMVEIVQRFGPRVAETAVRLYRDEQA